MMKTFSFTVKSFALSVAFVLLVASAVKLAILL